jgi:NADH-quinone oxidoreductase subunit N
MWVPDVYQGAPSPITGFMGAAIKLAGFGFAIRLFWELFLPIAPAWKPILTWLAIITMFVGNIAALAQDNLKRLFAYSSISHAGYLLVGLTAAAGSAAAPSTGPLFYYLLVYGLMFLGLLACIQYLETATGSTEIFHLSGLGFTHPLIGLCIAVFALSGAGIPPTAGFFAKYFLFMEAVKAGNVMLVVLAVISSLIGVYYYLRVIVFLYMKESKDRVALGARPGLTYACILFCALSLFVFAFSPGWGGLR